ncbi:hypothetical protein EYZ11_001678 [Aspergillus tanneri]|uniref:Peptidase S54 rhomboid domain-containing protein n=1 Tax=Aspergillus tanneri TaxID=1220188 RepID=A0A4S3JUA5_9EURO|nr:hypothetical protein EYZ11_001678 [Aspergillus tanneri]
MPTPAALPPLPFNPGRWGSLTPNEIGLGTMYRLNTYPLIHIGFFHALLNLLALTPLLERFEAEHGTLTSVALFIGPLSTFPAGLYLLVEKVILHRNTAVVGARIPTWTSPLVACVMVSILMPNTSFLGHLCAIAIGYLPKDVRTVWSAADDQQRVREADSDELFGIDAATWFHRLKKPGLDLTFLVYIWYLYGLDYNLLQMLGEKTKVDL